MQNEKPKLKFAVAVEMGDRWYCGPRRFSTEEDAREWGEQFYQSHPSVKAYTVVPMAEGVVGGEE